MIVNHRKMLIMKSLAKKSFKTKPATITLSEDIMAAVDNYVKTHKKEGISRSAVIEEGVRMWLQTLRDKQDLEYFTKNAKVLQGDNKSWSRISTAAAKEIFK
jgi:Arc/MetJ-type ribon-helix-helix transcriptional regulator